MSSTPNVITVDFETYGIEPRPDYPPKPVGVAIKWPSKRGIYYGWGHHNGNTCKLRTGMSALRKAWMSGLPLLFHNAKFDVDVAETHCGMPPLPWNKIHDTLFLLFLDNPHAKTLSLKPSSERVLGLKSSEQDMLMDWITTHIRAGGRLVSRKYAGSYISQAPGSLVAKYAVGDVVRTHRLFQKLWQAIRNRGMLSAYDTERELMPILLANERRGIRVDLQKMSEDLVIYTNAFDKATFAIHKQLGYEINLNSGQQLIKALIDGGLVNQGALRYTAKGTPCSDVESLGLAVTNRKLLTLLTYRSRLKTCLGTFLGPWVETANRSGGVIHTSWNQVRGAKYGTRTGRLSSTPNFQNIPKIFDPLWKNEAADKASKKLLPACPIRGGLPSLPHMRSYIIPWLSNHVLIDRDYSQQELRILAHFSDGNLAAEYMKNPWLDVHAHAQQMINGMLNANFARKPIKNTAFGLIYGMGVAKTAEKSKCSFDEAAEVRRAYLAGFPELREMQFIMKTRAANGEPIYTYNGREYYCEEPKIIDGRVRTFDYKLINVLVQGSAADCTKLAMIEYAKVQGKNAIFYLSVHDEFLVSSPKRGFHAEMRRLDNAMGSVKFSVPMLSEGTVGTNWDDLKPYDKKGKRVYAKQADS